jgi:hypothetical protein
MAKRRNCLLLATLQTITDFFFDGKSEKKEIIYLIVAGN